MKIITIAGFEWIALKQIGDKTFLFAKDVFARGYFDAYTNNFESSKLKSFLNETLVKKLTEAGFDCTKIANGIWPITIGQYNIYIKDKFPNATMSWFLRSPGSTETTILSIDTDGEVVENSIDSKCGIRPGMMVDTEYVTSFVTGQIEDIAEEKPVLSEIKMQEKTTLPSNSHRIAPSISEVIPSLTPYSEPAPVRRPDDFEAKQTILSEAQETADNVPEQPQTNDNTIKEDTEKTENDSQEISPDIMPAKKKRRRKRKKKTSPTTSNAENFNFAVDDMLFDDITPVSNQSPTKPQEDVPSPQSDTVITVDNAVPTNEPTKVDTSKEEPVSTEIKTEESEPILVQTPTPEASPENAQHKKPFVQPKFKTHPIPEQLKKKKNEQSDKESPLPESIVAETNLVSESNVESLPPVATVVPISKPNSVNQIPSTPIQATDATTPLSAQVKVETSEPVKSQQSKPSGRIPKPSVSHTAPPIVAQKELKRTNNTTFQENNESMKRGQNAILNRLGRKTPEQEAAPPKQTKPSSMADVVGYYHENAPTQTGLMVRTQQPHQNSERTQPSETSEGKSAGTDAIIAQMKAIIAQQKETIIKNNRQIASLKISLIETNAESETLMEKVDILVKAQKNSQGNTSAHVHELEEILKSKEDEIAKLKKRFDTKCQELKTYQDFVAKVTKDN